MVVGTMAAVIVPLCVNERVTVPVKPPTGVTVMLQLPDPPRVTGTGCGEHAVRVKSVTLTVTVVLWDRLRAVPLIDGVVPVTVTV